MAAITPQPKADAQAQKNNEKDKVDEGTDKKSRPRTASDVQRLRLEKLMQNPEKPVDIPQARNPKGPRKPREFIRHIMGSSAAAGSGDFHIYRGVRRRENEREAYKEKLGKEEQLDIEWEKKREEHQQMAEDRVIKNRTKRQKKKERELRRKKFLKSKESEKKKGSTEESEVGNTDKSCSGGAEVNEDDVQSNDSGDSSDSEK